jgi:hypothetical protein
MAATAIDDGAPRKRKASSGSAARSTSGSFASGGVRANEEGGGLLESESSWGTCQDGATLHEMVESLGRAREEHYPRSEKPELRMTDYYPATDRIFCEALRRYCRNELRSGSKMCQIFDNGHVASYVMVPIVSAVAGRGYGNHFVVVFVDGRHAHRCVYYFDSLAHAVPAALRQRLDQATKHSEKKANGVAEPWSLRLIGLGRTNSGEPLQSDGYQCLVWALTAEIWFADFLSSGSSAAFDVWLKRIEDGRWETKARRAHFIAQRRREFQAA